MAYSVLAFVVVAVHFGYLGYLVAGGYLAWRWPRTLPLHMLAAAWAFFVVALSWPCPLTSVQDWFRVRAGERQLSRSFLDTYVQGVFYPAHQEQLVRIVVALVVVGSWVGLVIRLRLRDRHTLSGAYSDRGPVVGNR
jgi:hypothetical protein